MSWIATADIHNMKLQVYILAVLNTAAAIYVMKMQVDMAAVVGKHVNDTVADLCYGCSCW